MASRVLSFALAALALGGALLPPGAEASGRALSQLFSAKATAFATGKFLPAPDAGQSATEYTYNDAAATPANYVTTDAEGLSTDVNAAGESSAIANSPTSSAEAIAENTQSAISVASASAIAEAEGLGGEAFNGLNPDLGARSIATTTASGNQADSDSESNSFALLNAEALSEATSTSVSDASDSSATSLAESTEGNADAESIATSRNYIPRGNLGGIATSEAESIASGTEIEDGTAYGRASSNVVLTFGDAATVATTVAQATGGDAEGVATASSETLGYDATSTATNTASGGLDDIVSGTVSSIAVTSYNDNARPGEEGITATASGSNSATAGGGGRATTNSISRAEFNYAAPPPPPPP